MDATLKALEALAVQAIPTVLFFIFLTHYLKRVYFQPVADILEERRKQTEGVRDLAKRAHEMADKRTSEFDAAVQLVRSQILQENDVVRKQWAEEQAKVVEDARALAEQRIAAARASSEKELEQAKTSIAPTIDQLASQITERLIKRRAA